MEKNITNQTRHNNTNNYIDNIDKYISILDNVYLYCLIVIIIFGIVGNLFSFFIFTRPNLNKKTNTGILYTILCIFNILIILEDTFIASNSMRLFNYMIPLYFNKINFEVLIRESLFEILSLIQVLICFDRFVLIIYPMKAHVMRKKVKSSFTKPNF